jgi:hypothetical protein
MNFQNVTYAISGRTTLHSALAPRLLIRISTTARETKPRVPSLPKMTWQPQEEPLRQLALYLKDSLSGHDQNAQKNAELVC